MSARDPLTDFERRTFSFDGVTRDVYRKGAVTGDSGRPRVLVMHEIPGITVSVANFSRRLVDAGFEVAMPDMFGVAGKPFSLPYAIKQVGKACISREVHVLAEDGASPLTDWLRALAQDLASEGREEQRPVGVLGMCLTGNFGLALAVDPWVRGPVLSQPSLPFPMSAKKKAALHVSPAGLQTLKKRTKEEGLKVLGLRFTHDYSCPGARFQTLRDELGDAFEGIEIHSGPGNPDGLPVSAHSVLTLEFKDEPGHPTKRAFDRTVEFLKEQLA